MQLKNSVLQIKLECELAKEELKRAKQDVGFLCKPLLQLTCLMFSGDVLETASDLNLERNKVQEPFDLPDHIGNTREGAMVAGGSYMIMGIPAIMLPWMVEQSKELVLRNARKVAVASFAVASAVQVVGEKYEISNSFSAGNVGDPIDAAYGVTWAGVVAYGLHRAGKSLIQNHCNPSVPTESQPKS